MTEKLFYKNSYLQRSKARILKAKMDKKGLWLQLDKNIFYPGGGGQLPDKGQIGGNNLAEIVEEEGIIWHCVEKNNVLNEGDEVSIKIDWPVRYKNMQQHSGQHLLSHVLWEHGLKTVSVHLGENYTMIEVEGKFPDDSLMQRIEDEANQLIREAIPIRSFIADRKEANVLSLRKPAGDWDELRIVEIDDMDFSACGGTHVNKTSEIGLIKYISSEKIRGHARLKFVIGVLAYAYFNHLHDIINQMKSILQTGSSQFPEKLNGLLNDLNTYKKEISRLKKIYIQFQCNKILKDNKSNYEIIVQELPNNSMDDIKDISQHLANEYNRINFIFGNGRFCLCTPDNCNFDTKLFMQELGTNLTLKGGGPIGFIQGKYSNIDIDKLVKALESFNKA